MTKDSVQFQKGDKVGFVYDNHLATGVFVGYEMDNTEAIVTYNGQQYRFSDCSIYKVNDNTQQKPSQSKTQKHGNQKNRPRANIPKR